MYNIFSLDWYFLLPDLLIAETEHFVDIECLSNDEIVEVFLGGSTS